MSQSDRAIKKFATQLARLDREVKSWRGAQADFTSIENGGNFTFKDSDGNVTAIMGGQDDGSNTIRHVDGPTPPVPSGLSAHVDGPIVQVSWDGTFEDADTATYDWSHLEVIVVGPGNEQLTATINDVTGASTSVAATASGEWTVVARSVSRAEKRSLDGDAGAVEVKLVDIDGAIEAVQDSANGKNKVTYSSHAPTSDDPGIFDDTWFVGQVGRPSDVVEATNLATNPSFQSMSLSLGTGNMSTRAGAVLSLSDDWSSSGSTSLKISGGTSWYTSAYVAVAEGDFLAGSRGKTFTAAIDFHLEAAHDDTTWAASRRLTVNVQRGGVMQYEFAASNKGGSAAGTTERLSVTFTVPADAEAWNITAFNGSQSSVSYWDSFDIAEVSAARPYFDGDTPSGATDNESHYRWTGTPHASTSEKYLPALDIGDSDNWNIIEQYRHDGTGWVKVELSHHVFSTVDLGKATVGELDGIRIMGQTIHGEQLSGDAIDGKVITGPTIQSGRSGRRWIGDPNGIRIINEDDDVRTQLSPDGSTFKGEVEADTLVVNDGAEFKGNNTLAQGAKLTLAAGVTDPTAPPVVQPYWDGVELSTAVYDVVGLAFDGTNYITARRSKGLTVTAYRQSIRGYKINASSGATTSFTFDFSSSPGSPDGNVSEVFGVTCIGSELFFLGRYGYNGYVWVTDLDGVFKRQLEAPSIGYSSTNPLTYRPGIGTDGTNVVIAGCDDAGPLNVHTVNKSTGALISTVKDTNDGTKSDITGVYVGNADWGRKLVTVAKKSTGKLPSFSATTGVYDGAATQFDAATPDSTGVVFAGGKWRTLDPAGKIHEYADTNTGDASGDWWATYYWYTDVDDDDIIESTDYQSRMAPPARFTWPRRAMLKILGQPMPTGVEALGPALAKKTSTPTRTDFHGPGWSVDTGKPSARYTELPTNWTTFASPSATNTFPEATSSVVESASGTFQVKGDGSGHWGPLTMGRNGIMSGLIVTGTVLVQPDQAGHAKKVTVSLPAGRFTKPPVVWVQASTSVPHNVATGVIKQEITTTTFNLYMTRIGSTTATGVTWFAMDSE